MLRKSSAIALTLLVSMIISSNIGMATAQGDVWNVSEGDKYRWTATDGYYDVTSENKDVDADIQDKTVQPIHYEIEYSEKAQASYEEGHEDEGDPFGGNLYLRVDTNAYAFQIWRYDYLNHITPGNADSFKLKLWNTYTENYSTNSLPHPTYYKSSWGNQYPLANYTVVFLSRWEYDYLDDYYGELEMMGKTPDDMYYEDYLKDGEMFKFGKLVNFAVNLTDEVENWDTNTITIAESADTEPYQISYDRYAHAEDPLSFQITTDSTEVSNVRVGFIYQDLITLDKIVFEKDFDVAEPFLNMYSSLEDMADDMQISPERIYQGSATRLVSVYLLFYNTEDQLFADDIEVQDHLDDNYIPPETNKTLLGFYSYKARFLESEFEYELDTEYTLGHIDMNIKELFDTEMDRDSKEDIEYTIDFVYESESPVEVKIPQYLDLGIAAPIFSLIDIGEVIGLEDSYLTNPHGISVPGAINYVYSGTGDNVGEMIDELLTVLNGTKSEPELSSLALGEILSTISFVNFMIVPTNFDYEDLENLLETAVDMLITQYNETDNTYEHDIVALLDIADYLNLDADDDGRLFNVGVGHNVMPYYYDIHYGPTQIGLDASWEGDFLQSFEVKMYQPSLDRVRIIKIAKTQFPTFFETVLAWVAFIGSIFGVGIALVVVRKKVKKKREGLELCGCNPSDPDCDCDF